MKENYIDKEEWNTEFCPLDTGGVIQLLTGIKEQVPAFLIDYSTKETIDRERLRTAVNLALRLFRPFKVKLELEGTSGKPVYRYNDREAEVYPYDGMPHFYGEESGGFLFRVYFRENRIFLSMLHALTDFFGGNAFLKCILCFFNVSAAIPKRFRNFLRLIRRMRGIPMFCTETGIHRVSV